MGLLVIDPGLSTTVQDLGRPGYRQWGVPPGGSFDRASAALANALVGNALDCAVLELTLRGGVYEADCPLALALAGATIEARVVRSGSREQRLELPLSFSLGEKERLILGRTLDGARVYLAVGAGWQTCPILGSRSSEKRITSGTNLPAQSGTTPSRHISQTAWRSPTAEPFRVIAGPDRLASLSLERQIGSGREFRVSSHADRVGVRLQGEPVSVASPPERLSTPVAAGAIQVAAGQLIILGVACGTMGGYPHIAHVISADLDRLGQIQPGDTIHFQPVSLSDSRQLDGESRRQNKVLADRLTLLARDEDLR
jgi:biotin-dependent carboxylase-like uncharacterized protein